jgi:hypothetical protein
MVITDTPLVLIMIRVADEIPIHAEFIDQLFEWAAAHAMRNSNNIVALSAEFGGVFINLSSSAPAAQAPV